jgi:Tfp pilus assembly protein PilF
VMKADMRWHANVVHSSDETSQYLTELKSVLNREPGNTIALRGLALALTEQKDYQGALRYLRQALDRDPKDARSHRAFSVLLGALEAAGSPDPAGNSSYEEAAICARLNPGYADAYRLMGFSLMRQGEYDQAESMMRKAVALSPRSEVYRLNLADIELKKQEYAPALALLQELKNSDSPEIAKQAEYFLAASVDKDEDKLAH